jgi:integrase
MNACQADATAAGTRDAAIIGLLYAAGLRRDELVRLGMSDFDPETGMLMIRGKRNKQRSAYITNGAADALKDWIAIRGFKAGALFVEVIKAGRYCLNANSMIVKPFKKIRGVDCLTRKQDKRFFAAAR